MGSYESGVVPEGRAGDTTRRLGPGLHEAVVGRGEDHGPLGAKMLEDGNAEGTALGGVRARPDLVEQDEGRKGEVARHGHDVGEVSGEGREVLGDGLVVADVGEDPPEHGHDAPLGSRE